MNVGLVQPTKKALKDNHGVNVSGNCLRSPFPLCCKPEGIYMEVMMHIVGMVTILGSIILVFGLGSRIVGLVLTLIYLRSAYVERSFCSSSTPGDGRDVQLRGLLGRLLAGAARPVCNLLPKQMDFTFTRGIVSPRLRLALSDGAIKRTALLLLLMPWATLEKASQTGISISKHTAVFSIVSFTLAMFALVKESMGAHFGGECRQLGEAIIKKKYPTCFQKLYIYAARAMVVSEVVATCTLNAVVMLLLTTADGPAMAPVAGLALFLPCMLALYYTLGYTGKAQEESEEEEEKESCWTLCRAVVFSPLHWFTFAYSSVFRLPMYSIAACKQYGNRPATPMVIAIFCRFAMSLSIVLWKMSGRTSSQLFGVDVYTKFLLIGAMIATPLYLVLLMGFAFSQKAWRFGEDNVEYSELDTAVLELMEVAGLFDIDEDL